MARGRSNFGDLMRHAIIAGLLLLVSGQALALQCPNPPPDPLPRDSVRMSWTAPTKNTDGSAIKAPITYTVYEGSTVICTTLNVGAGLSGLSVGTHTWT